MSTTPKTTHRAVIREGAVWADVAPQGDDLWARSFTGTVSDLDPDYQWSTAIDVLETYSGADAEQVDTVYVPASEEWEPNVYRDALYEAGWTITGYWNLNNVAIVAPKVVS